MRHDALAHRVIRASAGAGKTFALSNRYLKLLMRGSEPREILATTFTRKAAGEILSRVLLRAARAARDENGAKQLARELKMPELDLAMARAGLARLVRELHAVSISTIDSFFSRIAQSFRMELALPADAMMVAPESPQAVQLRAEAIEAMLADDDPLVLVDLLRRLHHDQAQRSVTEAIDAIVRDMYEVYRLSPEARAWSALSPVPCLSEADVALALQGVDEVMISDALGKQLVKAVSKVREAAHRRDWEAVLGQTLVRALGEGGSGTYGRTRVPDDVAAALRPIAVQARAKVIEKTAARTTGLHDLLARFAQHDARLRQLHRVQFFSDLPLKIGGELLERGEASDTLTHIYYRLDGRVRHLLLDEFQDTSIEQWRVLMPFAQEICLHSEERDTRTFFCVGDMKQAIYGWRGGCAELFAQVESDLQLDERARASLHKSYRSSQVVLDAVNRVFGDIAAAPPLMKHAQAAQVWQCGFENHLAARDLSGYVELITSTATGEAEVADAQDNGQEPSAREDHLIFAAKKVRQLAEQAPGRSIGVLVRTNDTVNRMIYHLRAMGLLVSGEGGNLLTDDPAVNVVLSALTMADHPGHTAATFHVLHSPLAPILGLTSAARAHVAAVSRAIRRDLLMHGYAKLIAGWAKQIAGACDPRGAIRLTQLIELADEYDPAITLRTSDFVRYVKATPVEEPTRAAVRVMTVHRAKGLEFDMVVMPELDRCLLRSQSAVWRYRVRETQPPAAVFASSNEALRDVIESHCPEYGLAHQQEMARRLQDDLSGLYVAMTRARRALYMIVQPLQPKSNGEPRADGLTNLSFASILRDRLRDAEESFNGGEVLYQQGDEKWHESESRLVAAPPAEAKPARAIGLAASRGVSRRTWRRVSPSSLEGQGRVAVGDLLALQTRAALRRGSLLHKFFEQVSWLEGDGPDDSQLAAAAWEVEPTIDASQLAQHIADFRAMLTRPCVRETLAPPALAMDERSELWRERAFAVRMDGQLLRGMFDRVVVVRRGGAVARAVLIDFKTDRVTSEAALADAATRYRPQALAYRKALAMMLNLHERLIETKLLFVAGDQVVDVGD